MKKYLLFLVVALFFFQGYGQFQIKEGTYSSFDGQKVPVYMIAGNNTVLKIDTTFITKDQLKDTLTLSTIIERIDSYYTSYKDFCGKEPSGGDSEYGYKSSVAFASPSCGAACGLIGSKGIEVSPNMFLQVFNETKLKINTNRIGIVGYEFGRNFFTIGGKLLFPYTPGTDERNGGFAEGFATVAGLVADLKYLTKQDSSLQKFQETIYFYNQLKRFFIAYLNDLKADPYNSLAKENQNNDINRNTWGYKDPAYYAASILVGVNETFKQENLFSQFFKFLEERKNANTIEDVLSNIAYCFSKSTNSNLLPYFQNVLKFKIDQATANNIQILPPAQDKLIYDQSKLWFTTPFDTIPLNIRSVNYLNQMNYYQLFADDSLISETTNGNNLICYSLLKKKDSAILTVKLLDSIKKEIDSYKITLKKRENLNMSDYRKDFTFFDTYGYCKPGFKDGVFSIVNIINKEAYPGLEMAIPFKRNRTILVTGQIKNQMLNFEDFPRLHSFSWISVSGWGTDGIGYDINRDDSLSFHDVSISFKTNGFFPVDMSEKTQFVIAKFYLFRNGVTKSYFKNVTYKDITDTDNDGIIDFEDPCPDVYGTFGGCPQSQTSVSNIKTDELNIYPNPTSDKLNIKTTEINGEIAIYDIFGNRVVHQKINNNNTEIDVSQFSQGTYLVHVISNNRTQTSKFVKM